jgi:transposase
LEQVGRDGSQLLSMLYQEGTPALLSHLPQVQILRKIWIQHFFWEEGHLRLRNNDSLPPAHLTLRSPYDPQAHIGRKGGFAWYGYKVHLSETCDAEYPHLITCVQTTCATASDMKQTQQVHEELARRNLLPQRHLVDAGYVDAGSIVESREQYGVELLGPVSRNNQWQAKAGKGYDQSGFDVDFSARVATCPQGHKSIHWREITDQQGHPILYIRTDRENLSRLPLPIAVYTRPRQAQSLDHSFSGRVSSVTTHSQAARNRGISGDLCETRRD